MCEKTRIEYALSIKQWCDSHPGATDLDLINFLQRIEQTIRDQVIKQSQRIEKNNTSFSKIMSSGLFGFNYTKEGE